LNGKSAAWPTSIAAATQWEGGNMSDARCDRSLNGLARYRTKQSGPSCKVSATHCGSTSKEFRENTIPIAMSNFGISEREGNISKAKDARQSALTPRKQS
jgi:hypothetical protein